MEARWNRVVWILPFLTNRSIKYIDTTEMASLAHRAGGFSKSSVGVFCFFTVETISALQMYILKTNNISCYIYNALHYSGKLFVARKSEANHKIKRSVLICRGRLIKVKWDCLKKGEDAKEETTVGSFQNKPSPNSTEFQGGEDLRKCLSSILRKYLPSRNDTKQLIRLVTSLS